jgi:hypothetical protein
MAGTDDGMADPKLVRDSKILACPFEEEKRFSK